MIDDIKINPVVEVVYNAYYYDSKNRFEYFDNFIQKNIDNIRLIQSKSFFISNIENLLIIYFLAKETINDLSFINQKLNNFQGKLMRDDIKYEIKHTIMDIIRNYINMFGYYWNDSNFVLIEFGKFNNIKVLFNGKDYYIKILNEILGDNWINE